MQMGSEHSQHSPYPQSYHSTSPSQSQHSQLRKSNSPQNNPNYLQAPSISAPSSGVPLSHPTAVYQAADGSYDFLSPNAYMSENAYSGASDHTSTSDFENGFYLEENFGMLADPNQNVGLEDLQQGGAEAGHRGSRETEGTRGSVDTDKTRTSVGTGIATLDSHLMSPVLTDSGESDSRQGPHSPLQDVGVDKPGNSDNVPAALIMHNVAQGNMEQAHPFPDQAMQITPTETNTSRSNGPSPDNPTGHRPPSNAPSISPVVRVESYSRGDSPARVRASSFNSTGRKRSRSGSRSSHLGARHNDGRQEETKAKGDYFSGAPDNAISEAARVGLSPEARYQVGNVEVPNFKDQEEKAQVAMKNVDVEEWLDRNEPGRESGANAPPAKPASVPKRQRARSAGAQSLSVENLQRFKTTVVDSHIPGPGVLVYEESGDEDEEENVEEMDLVSLDQDPEAVSPTAPVNDVPGQARPGDYAELPNQPPLYRAKLWQDPLHDMTDPGVKLQPVTANDAIMRFQQRAESIDATSRRGTWGSRRLSESDLRGLLHQLSFSQKSSDVAMSAEKRERRSSFLKEAAAKLVSRKSGNILKLHASQHTSPQQSARPSVVQVHQRKDSSDSRKDSLTVPGSPPPAPTGMRRMSSVGKRPRSPRINTSSAVAAMAFQTGALGAGGSISATAPSAEGSWPQVRRQRSKSDVHGMSHHHQTSNLADMWTHSGGPPMPSLAAPSVKEEKLDITMAGVEDDDEDDGMEDTGVSMDLSIRPDSIIPTLEGFRSNIRQLNPRLPPFMFDRIAQEQLRRFKKLLDFKIKHVQAVNMGKCSSGKHCTELGGEPTYLPSKSSGRDSEITHTGFSVAGLGQSDEDVNALAEGIVTPAQFPPGVPMPPVKRLPAEFECSLCFKVKKFHKPSDWSKHVHEDVQPFTCTFATCAEPKSFKRKADWVRHENERHRQLEWWMCNMNDCSHKCYRKDNFVQHLVREHKLPEPKVKTTKAGKPAVRGPSSQKSRTKQENAEDGDEIDQVWKLVEECRHETPKNPKDEACKFCGNICNSWKKLTVHLAKHMEQISMPVLGVVKQKEVTAETIISPIEQRMGGQTPNMSPSMQIPYAQPGQNISPFGMPIGGIHGSTPTPGSGGYSMNPGGLTPGGNYFPTQEPMSYQRVSPNTYPPPSHTQHLSANYNMRPSPLNPMSSYGSQSSSSYSQSSTPFSNPVNARRTSFSQQPANTSPENLYGGMPAPSVPNPVHARRSSFQSQSPVNSSAENLFGSMPAPSVPNPVNARRGSFHSQSTANTSPENLYGGLPAPNMPTSQPRATPYDDNSGFQYVAQPQQTFQSPIEGVGYQFGNQTPSSYPQQAPTPSAFSQQQQPTPAFQPQTTPPTVYGQPTQMSPPPNTFRGQQTTSPTSYPQPMNISSSPNPPSYQQQPQPMSGQLGMQYNPMGQGHMSQMQGFSQPSLDPSLYAQHQQHRHQQQQSSQSQQQQSQQQHGFGYGQ